MAVSANTYAEHEDVERLVGDFVEYARDSPTILLESRCSLETSR